MKPFYIISAADDKNGIGKDGLMPWHFSGEMKHFRETTTNTTDPDKWNMVIMGSTTWESLPEKARPLKDRRNIVLARREENYQAEGGEVASSFDDAFNKADDKVEKTFIIGGASIYAQTINNPNLVGIYLTRVHKVYDCDTFFPEIPAEFSNVEKLGEVEENGVKYEFLFYTRA